MEFVEKSKRTKKGNKKNNQKKKMIAFFHFQIFLRTTKQQHFKSYIRTWIASFLFPL
jgi:hypothetical protein